MRRIPMHCIKMLVGYYGGMWDTGTGTDSKI